MEDYPKITLKTGKEYALKRFHPWIFSGALKEGPSGVQEGDIAEVFSASGEYLATAHCQRGGIALKVISFERCAVNEAFWHKKLAEAVERRRSLGLLNLTGNNACRLVFSEGDGMPGLIIDWFDGIAVIQSHSMGMHLAKPALVKALQEIFGDRLKAVYDKSRETMKGADGGKKSDAGAEVADGFLYGQTGPAEILETGHRFMVDFERGQKTGFFLDQRSNRMLAQFYANGRTMLNAFCYSGAFSVYALKGGAARVDSVDSSRPAIDWAKENIALNGIPEDRHREFIADVKQFLPASGEKYDMIILDPPAFAKRHDVSHNALQAYIHINAEALKKLNAGGILFTFSCSQAISREMFRSALQAAAIETGRLVRLLHHLSQGSDHPVSIYHPEGEYLKGMVLLVT